MPKKVFLDAGHGGSDSGAIGIGLYEKNVVLNMALKLRDYLKSNFEVEVYMARTNDITLSLPERTNLANDKYKVDFYFSLHNNAAYDKSAHGYEDFIHPITGSATIKYRDIIHQEVVNRVLGKYGIRNRGKKKANFHVLRETDMSSMLVETLFISNPNEQKLLENPTFINDIVVAYGEGIGKALGLARKKVSKPPTTSIPSPSTNIGTIYKLQNGAFKSRANALDLERRLKLKGFQAYTYYDNGLYRVQSGAYRDIDGAREIESKQRKAGFNVFVYRE